MIEIRQGYNLDAASLSYVLLAIFAGAILLLSLLIPDLQNRAFLAIMPFIAALLGWIIIKFIR
jgi:hypothetical protein